MESIQFDATAVRGMLAADRMAREAGVELVDVGPGWARMRLEIEDRHLNGVEIAHGAAAFMLADTALGAACNSHGRPSVTRSCQIEFLASARCGDVLEVTARERARNGRSGIYDATVTRERDGAVLAEARGTCIELRSGD